MRYRLPFLSLLIVVLLAWGPAGRALAQCFKVYEPRGRTPVTYLCQGSTYWVRNCAQIAPGTPVFFDKDSRDGRQNALDTITTLLATVPGRMRITQLINRGTVNDTLGIPFVIYPTTMPLVRVTPCLRSVQVALLDPIYTQFAVSFSINTGAAQTVTKNQGELAYSGLVPGTNAGTIRVRVTGTNAGRCPSEVYDTLIQIAAQPPAPRIRWLDVLAPTSARQVRLALDRLTVGAGYVLERAPATGTTWTPLDTLVATADVDTLLRADAPTRLVHRYRLRLLNGTCDRNATAPPTPIVSPEVGALPINVTTLSKQNVVTWAAWPGTATVNAYVVFRNGREITRLPSAIRTFTDRDVTCLRTYCYEVAAQMLLVDDVLKYFSGDSCVVGISTTAPPPPTKFKASFDLRNNLVLTALPPASVNVATAAFSEQPRSGGSAVAVGTSPTPVLVIPAPDTAHVRLQCYSATLADSCGLTSAASPTGCPVVLGVNRNAEKTKAFLRWKAYQGFPTPTYRVQLLDDQTNAIIFDTLVGFALTYTDDLRGNPRQIRRYRIRAEFVVDTFTVSFSNVFDLVDEAFIRLPNAFTPNGDGLNDTFGPAGRFELRESTLTVYDRWGKLLFQTTKPNEPWDGRAAGGDIVPPGVYVYLFRGRDATGREYNQRGMVTVLR